MTCSDGARCTYLDYAATAPLAPEALAAMQPHLQAGPAGIMEDANPNSLSKPGRAAFKALEAARRSLASSLGASRPDEVIFTSGATEADNAALSGIAHAAFHERTRAMSGTFAPHVITTQIEHDAVLMPAKRLESQGFEVTYLKPDRDGFIAAADLEQALRDETVLVSVQLANSEIGSVQAISQLASIAHERGALFHTDAVQGLGKVEADVSKMGVDAASFSAHKIGGPYGVGALYLRRRTPFEPLILGGGQESGRRSGTQNVCGAVGFAAAASVATSDVEADGARMREMRDALYARLSSFERIQPTVACGAGSRDFLPNIVNVLIEGVESQTAVLRFDALGFAVSGGSACSSGSLDASHVLTACGISSDEAQTELRVSLGRGTDMDQVEAFLRAVPKVLDWGGGA